LAGCQEINDKVLEMVFVIYIYVYVYMKREDDGDVGGVFSVTHGSVLERKHVTHTIKTSSALEDLKHVENGVVLFFSRGSRKSIDIRLDRLRAPRNRATFLLLPS
jgi:hypothetical protein